MNRLTVIILAAGLLTCPAAFAHTELVSSTPADNTVLESVPKAFTLKFTEAAKLTVLSVQLRGGDKQELGPLPAAMQESFIIPAPELTSGSYTLSWRALTDDGHVAHGELTFEVK